MRAWGRWWWPLKRVAIQLPTGSGKTVIAGSVIDKLLMTDDNKVLFVCHTKSILNQTVIRFEQDFNTSQVGDGLKDYSGWVVVATIQSLVDCPRNMFTHAIVDECHLHDTPRFKALLRRLGNARFLGLSATMLGEPPSWVQRVVFTQKVKPLQRQGYLAKAKVKRVKARTYRDVVKLWQRKASDRRTIVFCKDTKQAFFVNAWMQKYGIDSALVTKDTPQRDRDEIEREAQVIVNCRVYKEGSDIPRIGCVVLLVSPKQQQEFIQRVGRGTRPDTEDCLVLAFGQVHSLEV